ncbi:hypothetical protein ILFOPFJJ_02710 [Ensifer psoraleae]|nr:hypothetical protein [Sinorhizobium psoraleae]
MVPFPIHDIGFINDWVTVAFGICKSARKTTRDFRVENRTRT